MKAIKLCSGLDISKADFHSCLILLQDDHQTRIIKSRKFSNTTKGVKEYIDWIITSSKKYEIPVYHIMEATGVYHESLALSLFKLGQKISVVLPNKSKKYIQALGFKTKNDKTDSKALALMGIQQNLSIWRPMGDYFYQLRAMTRMYQNYQESITSLRNQIEALSHGMYKQTALIKDLKDLIKRYEKLSLKLVDRIEKHLGSEEKVNEKVEGVCQIKGLSKLTLAVLLAETNGFELFKNARQLVSYAGYDVVENQSGKHRGRTKISKKGNSRIRRSLFMPAFVAVTHEKRFKDFYDRIMENKDKKMIGYTAVQKKLLVIVYSLWKNNRVYKTNYLNKEERIIAQEQKNTSMSFVLEKNKNSAA